MKKVGKLTEARMVKPVDPKFYPIVSDDLFEGAVKGYPEMGIKGGTPAAKKEAEKRMKMKKRKKLEEDDLPMNRRGRITQAGPAPKVNTDTYQTYNSMTDAMDPSKNTDSPTANFENPKFATPEMRKKMKDRAEAIKKFKATLKK